MNYHITAAKVVKPCTCGATCRAKHGRYENELEADHALAELTGQAVDPPSDPRWEELALPVETVEETAAPPAVEDSSLDEDYFGDDERFLKSEDKLLSATPSAALIEQEANLVSWRLENFYDEDGKRRSRLSLRADPPIFRVESSDGAAAEFVLTKNLAVSLSETFDAVKRGYYGVDPKRKGSLTQAEAKGKWASATAWMGAHPLKTGVLVLLLLFMALTAFSL